VLRLLFQRRHERLEDRPFNIKSLGAQADLPGVEERGPRNAGDSGFEIAIGKHNAGILTAQLERDRADPVGRGLHDLGAGTRLAGKGHCGDAGVAGQMLACRACTEAVHNVIDTRRNANCLHNFAQQRGGRRCLLRGFHDNGVAAGQRRGDFPSHEQKR
jgi:hypothetical protein